MEVQEIQSGVSEGFPCEDRGVRVAASIQSTPRAKPGPWKWDLWGSQWSLRPLKSVPDSTLANLSGVPTPWAIWRTVKGIACVFGSAIFACSNRVTWLPQAWKTGFTKDQETKWPFWVLMCNICDISQDSSYKGWGPQRASRLNLDLLPSETLQRIHQSIIVSSCPRQN